MAESLTTDRGGDQSGGFSLAQLSLKDVPSLVRLSREADWPHSGNDWNAIVKSGHGWGFRTLNKQFQQEGSLHACGFVFPHGQHFASLGMMLVAARYQKQGLGTKLVHSLLKHVERTNPSIKTVGLIAGSSASNYYARFGFQAMPTTLQVWKRPKDATGKTSASQADRAIITPIQTMDQVHSALELDARMTGFQRNNVIKYRIQHAVRHALFRDDCQINSNPNTGNATTLGYGMANIQENNLLSIGPIVAQDTDMAASLIQYLMDHEGHDGPTRIDVYSGNKDLEDVLAEIGFQKASEKGQPIMMLNTASPPDSIPTTVFPHGDPSKIFATASQSWF